MAAVPLVILLLLVAPVWARAEVPDLATATEALARGPDTAARMAAAKQLGASRDARALEPLVAALGDPNRDVRWAAIEALGELGDRRAVGPLVRYLGRDEAYRWGRRLVANALGTIGEREAVEALVGLLEDPDPFVRRSAAIALLWTGEPAGVARVATLLRDTGDETLDTVRREFAKAEGGPDPHLASVRAPGATAEAKPAIRPREWAGLRVGTDTLLDARARLGSPLQETASSLLFRGARLRSPIPVESIVVNGDGKGLIESVFVFPAWGTMEGDVRALLGRGRMMSYGEFLRVSGRTAHGAGTRAQEKLHYLPADLFTESYPALGILVVYDSAEVAARDRLVRLLIVY